MAGFPFYKVYLLLRTLRYLRVVFVYWILGNTEVENKMNTEAFNSAIRHLLIGRDSFEQGNFNDAKKELINERIITRLLKNHCEAQLDAGAGRNGGG